MTIRYELIPTLQIDDLEEALEAKGIELSQDLRNLFWPEDYINDCYKSLYYADDADLKWDDNAEVKNRIYKALREYLPNYKGILVDVSW